VHVNQAVPASRIVAREQDRVSVSNQPDVGQALVSVGSRDGEISFEIVWWNWRDGLRSVGWFVHFESSCFAGTDSFGYRANEGPTKRLVFGVSQQRRKGVRAWMITFATARRHSGLKMLYSTYPDYEPRHHHSG
jgi:hypothetical protein